MSKRKMDPPSSLPGDDDERVSKQPRTEAPSVCASAAATAAASSSSSSKKKEEDVATSLDADEAKNKEEFDIHMLKTEPGEGGRLYIQLPYKWGKHTPYAIGSGLDDPDKDIPVPSQPFIADLLGFQFATGTVKANHRANLIHAANSEPLENIPMILSTCTHLEFYDPPLIKSLVSKLGDTHQGAEIFFDFFPEDEYWKTKQTATSLPSFPSADGYDATRNQDIRSALVAVQKVFPPKEDFTHAHLGFACWKEGYEEDEAHSRNARVQALSYGDIDYVRRMFKDAPKQELCTDVAIRSCIFGGSVPTLEFLLQNGALCTSELPDPGRWWKCSNMFHRLFISGSVAMFKRLLHQFRLGVLLKTGAQVLNPNLMDAFRANAYYALQVCNIEVVDWMFKTFLFLGEPAKVFRGDNGVKVPFLLRPSPHEVEKHRQFVLALRERIVDKNTPIVPSTLPLRSDLEKENTRIGGISPWAMRSAALENVMSNPCIYVLDFALSTLKEGDANYEYLASIVSVCFTCPAHRRRGQLIARLRSSREIRERFEANPDTFSLLLQQLISYGYARGACMLLRDFVTDGTRATLHDKMSDIIPRVTDTRINPDDMCILLDRLLALKLDGDWNDVANRLFVTGHTDLAMRAYNAGYAISPEAWLCSICCTCSSRRPVDVDDEEEEEEKKQRKQKEEEEEEKKEKQKVEMEFLRDIGVQIPTRVTSGDLERMKKYGCALMEHIQPEALRKVYQMHIQLSPCVVKVFFHNMGHEFFKIAPIIAQKAPLGSDPFTLMRPALVEWILGSEFFTEPVSEKLVTLVHARPYLKDAWRKDLRICAVKLITFREWSIVKELDLGALLTEDEKCKILCHRGIVSHIKTTTGAFDELHSMMHSTDNAALHNTANLCAKLFRESTCFHEEDLDFFIGAWKKEALVHTPELIRSLLKSTNGCAECQLFGLRAAAALGFPVVPSHINFALERISNTGIRFLVEELGTPYTEEQLHGAPLVGPSYRWLLAWDNQIKARARAAAEAAEAAQAITMD